MYRKPFRSLPPILFLLFLFLTVRGPVRVQAESLTTCGAVVEFHQSEARQMLSLVNQHRIANGAGTLQYDYYLEDAAMQRCAEIVMSFSHTRPDGSRFFTAIPSDYAVITTYSNRGENIASGYSDAESAFTAFKNSSGHNANMLNTDFQYAAFCKVVSRGRAYWVQLFHTHSSGRGYTAPADGNQYKSITYDADRFSTWYMTENEGETKYITAGEWVALPAVVRVVGSLPAGSVNVTWSAENTSVAQISGGGYVMGLGRGYTTLTAHTADGKTASFLLSVTPRNIQDAVITLPSGTRTYTGQPHTPQPAVTYNGAALTEGTDYTLSYYSNTNAGTASVEVQGIGKYTSWKTVTFQIEKAAQSVQASISVSELQTGSTASVAAKGYGTFTYTSSNRNVATVNPNGLVTAVSPGTAVITVTASSSNYQTASASLSVTVKAAKRKISDCSIQGIANKTYTGSARTQNPSIRFGSSELILNRDYTLQYSGNIYVGTAAVTITGTGDYTGSITRYFSIAPRAVTIRKVKALSKGFTVTWTRASGYENGYQVQYALNKKFTSGKKTKTVKKLSTTSLKVKKLKTRRKYYVRIRVYQKKDGKTYYSAWSKVKSVKTK